MNVQLLQTSQHNFISYNSYDWRDTQSNCIENAKKILKFFTITHLRTKGWSYLRIDCTNLNPFDFTWRTQILQKYVYMCTHIPNRIPKLYEKYANVNEQGRYPYLLSVVPCQTTVNIEGESSGHIYGGDAEPRRERLEYPIPYFARNRHFPLTPEIRSHDHFPSSQSLLALMEIPLASSTREN